MRKVAFILMGMAAYGSITLTRDLRTPLAIDQWYIGNPYFDWDVCNDHNWSLDVWGAGYHRYADQTYLDKNTTKTEPLDALFFNEADFKVIQIFDPASDGPVLAKNPFIIFATISPRFTYKESGCVFGVNFDYVFGCEGQWHAGFRAELPVRMVRVERDTSGDEGAFEETLEDVVSTQNENVPLVADASTGEIAFVQNAFAYRMDFLAALNMTVNPPLTPLVNFFNTAQSNITINQKVVTGLGLPDPYPVHVVFRSDGKFPPAPYTVPSSQIGTTNGGPGVVDLAANGSGPFTPVIESFGAPANYSVITERARFGTGINYTPLKNNAAALKTLFLVPTGEGTSPVNFGPSSDARNIQTAVQSIINNLQSTSVIEFLLTQSVSFASQRNAGVGDMSIEGYVGHSWNCSYAEGRIGIIFPTGGRIRNESDNNPQLLLLLPRGANGHFGIKCGAEADWLIKEWFICKAYGEYVFMLPWNEKVAAAFQGATIKNIGPTVNANVSWHYFLGTLDVCLVHPWNQYIGVDLAYQLYVKSKDRIHFKNSTATDFLGNVEPLDATVLEQRTNVVSNKLMATLFYQGTYWEFFARGARIIAGKNVPRETEVVVGITINF